MPSDPLRQQGRWDLSLKQTIDQALALREEIKASLAESEQLGWSAKAISNQVLPSFWLQASSGLEGDRYTQRSTTTKSGRGMSISRTQDAGLYFTGPLKMAALVPPWRQPSENAQSPPTSRPNWIASPSWRRCRSATRPISAA